MAQYAKSEDDFDVTHRTLTLLLGLDVRVTDELQASLAVPWKDFENDTEIPGGDRNDSGIGDVTASILWQPWRREAGDELLDYRRLGLIAGLKFPTGDSDLDRFSGSTGEVVPLGNGTYDALVGVAYGAPAGERVTLFSVLVAGFPLRRNDDEPPAGTVLGSPSALTIMYRLGGAVRCAEWLDAYLAVDVQRKRDVDFAPAEGDTGKTLVFLTAGVVVHGPSGTFLDLSWRAAHELFTVGIGKSF